MNPDVEIDRIQDGLMAEAPAGFAFTVLSNTRLRDALLAFRTEAVEGLRSRPADLEPRLLLRKREVIAALPESHYSLERLLARAVQEVTGLARTNS